MLPVSPFVSQVNRASGETMRMQATQEGPVPLKSWTKARSPICCRCGLREDAFQFVRVGDDAVDPMRSDPKTEIDARFPMRTKSELFLDRLRPLPTRGDIHELEVRLGERMDSLAARFDRAMDLRVS